MKKNFKKPLSVMTSVSMALSMMSSFPLITSAEDGVPYLVRSWNADIREVMSGTAYCSDGMTPQLRTISGGSFVIYNAFAWLWRLV